MNTQIQYRRTVGAWLRFISADESEEGAQIVVSATASDAYAYVAELKKCDAQPGRSAAICPTVSAATVRRTVVILDGFYRALIRAKFLTESPFTGVLQELPKSPGNDRRPHRVIPFEKVEELFNRSWPKKQTSHRDRAALALLFGAALRSNELLAIRLCDIHENKTVTLRNTKRQRAEVQAVPDWAFEMLTSYAQIRRIEGAKESDFVFVSYTKNKPGDVIPDRTFRRMFARLMVSVGLSNDLTPHDARATAITRLRVLGCSYEEIMPFSRHASTAMVQHYDKLIRTEGGIAAGKLNYQKKES